MNTKLYYKIFEGNEEYITDDYVEAHQAAMDGYFVLEVHEVIFSAGRAVITVKSEIQI